MTPEERTHIEAGVEPEYAALYAGLPDIDCRRQCARHCGPIVVPEAEWRRMQRATGGAPEAESVVCGHLDAAAGLCRAHPLRPLICRLWGVLESMPCPYGCEPERWVTQAEADALLERALALSEGRVTAAWHGWRAMLERAPDAPTAAERPALE